MIRDEPTTTWSREYGQDRQKRGIRLTFWSTVSIWESRLGLEGLTKVMQPPVYMVSDPVKPVFHFRVAWSSVTSENTESVNKARHPTALIAFHPNTARPPRTPICLRIRLERELSELPRFSSDVDALGPVVIEVHRGLPYNMIACKSKRSADARER